MISLLLQSPTLEEALANTKLLFERDWTLTELILDDAFAGWTEEGSLSDYLKTYADHLQAAIGDIKPKRIKALFNGRDEYQLAIEAILSECRTLAEHLRVGDGAIGEGTLRQDYSRWKESPTRAAWKLLPELSD